MKKPFENYAFIDSQNLNLGIRDLGWSLDFKKFRIYLREKYGVKKAFLFLGFIPANQGLYTALQSNGFILVFKPILEYKDGKVKGNCDAELVLQAMIELPNYKEAILISGDGDFHCLVKYLLEKKKLKKVLAPSHASCSILLTRLLGNQINFVEDLQQKLSYTKKGKHPS
ncbi:MAG: NYN domain-containing protein [Candidatus Gracilibacteria bacterium]